MIKILLNSTYNDHAKLGGCDLMINNSFLSKSITQLLLCILIVATGMMTACAKEESPTKKQQALLTQVTTAKQDIEKNYLHYNFKKGYKSTYQFTLMLPKTWKTDPAEAQYPTDENLKLLAKVVDSQNIQDANITVWSALLTHEIHPSDWLENWLENQQYHVLNSRTLPADYGYLGDFLARKEGHIFRLLVIKDGNRLFLLKAQTKIKTYKQYEESFLLAIQSFQLLNPNKEIYAELFKQYTTKKPYKIALRYPTSWKYRAEEDDLEIFSFSLINQKDKVMLGHINTVLAPASLNIKPIDMLQTWIDKMKANNILAENTINHAKTKQLKHGKITTWKSKAIRDNASIELNNSIIEHDKGLLMFSLISPSKARNHNAWAVNQRTYEILVNTATY